jgi:hypothetical protein
LRFLELKPAKDAKAAALNLEPAHHNAQRAKERGKYGLKGLRHLVALSKFNPAINAAGLE